MICDFKTNFDKIVRRIRKKRIIVLCGGFGDERDASLETGDEVYQELLKHKFLAIKLNPARKNITKILNAKNDIVFNCLHGKFGEDGRITAILDYLKIPYTFSDIYASVVCMDKLFFKSVLKKLRIGCPKDNFDTNFAESGGIFLHKKTRSGGSIGMFESKKYKNENKDYFIENFIDGKIITMGVLEKNGAYEPLGITEINLKGKRFYDKEAKYAGGFSDYLEYTGKMKKQIEENTLEIFRFLKITNFARIDLIEKNHKLYFLEVNTIPGLYEVSNMVFSAQAKGLSFFELLIWALDGARYEKL